MKERYSYPPLGTPQGDVCDEPVAVPNVLEKIFAITVCMAEALMEHFSL